MLSPGKVDQQAAELRPAVHSGNGGQNIRVIVPSYYNRATEPLQVPESIVVPSLIENGTVVAYNLAAWFPTI